MRWPSLRHPIYGLPFDAPLHNALEAEYRRQSAGERVNAMRRVVQREALLLLTGQAWRRVAKAPLQARNMLWIYDWTTLGDSLMDLAVRRVLPNSIRLEMCIDASLAPLFGDDPRIARICTRIEDCTGPYDFVLLQELKTTSVSKKLRCAPGAPFASVFGHLRGERFDRMAFAQRRFEQLFGLPRHEPVAQWLELGPEPPRDAGHTRVAVALGARDPRRWYRRWPEVLGRLVRQWPAERAPAEFVLLGDHAALDELARFPADLLERHCRVEVARLDLRGVADLLHGCDFFLGADGGLMHLAVACGLPGLALFVDIDPAFRLAPQSAMRSLFTGHPMMEVSPELVAKGLLGVIGETRL